MFMVAAMMRNCLQSKLCRFRANQVLHEWFKKYLGSKDFKSYLKTFLMIQHLYKMTNELYTNMIYLSFLFNQDSILISVNWIHNFVEALSSQDQSKIWIRILSSDPVFFTSPIYSAILAVFAINSNFPQQNTLEQDCL